jgi:hypothetical protein
MVLFAPFDAVEYPAQFVELLTKGITAFGYEIN